MLSTKTRELLESSALAHLSTVNRDGSPQASCVWVGLDGDEIVSGHLHRSTKVQNVERDPRVVLTIEAPSHNESGLRQYLVITGRARVQRGGAPELLQRLAHTYLGPSVEFPPPESDPGYVLRIVPDRLGGIGPWSDDV